MFQVKTWQARQGIGLNKFSIDGGVPVTLVNRPDQVIIPGDAFSEENMNDLERRIAMACAETYGVKIDKANSNPESRVEYTDGAAGLTPASGNNGSLIPGSWSDKYPFNKIRPCLVKDGVVVGYLNPDNYAQFADGTAADITSGNAGDVMVEIPIFYYKISENSTHTFVQISATPRDGFTDKAFRYNGELTDAFYVGAYKGFIDSDNRLRSLSGKTPTASKTIGAFRTAAHKNGDGYEQMVFNKLTALQALYLIKFKSTNSQAALGQGYTGGSAAVQTGATDANGMDYGTTSATGRVKCNGIEDFWGNVFERVDGFKTTSNSVKTADGNFNDNADGYEEHACTVPNTGGYLKDIVGDNELAFTPKTFRGSTSTYYADYGYLSSDCLPAFGGGWADGAGVGAFYLDCRSSASVAQSNFGARLLLCKAKKAA